MATYDGIEDDIVINNNVDIVAMVEALVNDTTAMSILSNAVSLILTKQARTKGNVFGIWAQKQPAPVVNPPKGTKRLN